MWTKSKSQQELLEKPLLSGGYLVPRSDTRSLPKLSSECFSKVDGQDGAGHSEALQGLVLFNIFISALIDSMDYAFCTCRQHQLGSELGNRIRVQNDGDEAERQHGKQGAAPKGRVLQISWRQQHPAGHEEGITREATILHKTTQGLFSSAWLPSKLDLRCGRTDKNQPQVPMSPQALADRFRSY